MEIENTTTTLTGILLDDELELTLVEVCLACAVETNFIVELVEEGVLEPSGGEPAEWCFAGTELQRATLAVRLQRDLGLNAAGVALTLELLDEVRSLRARLAS